MHEEAGNTKYWVDPGNYGRASDQQLEYWGRDPNCTNMGECAQALSARITKRANDNALGIAKQEELRAYPFDPRTEVSADARHVASRIVTHLWILFVLLPFVAGVLFALLMAIK
jgi:hypothetical protein